MPAVAPTEKASASVDAAIELAVGLALGGLDARLRRLEILADREEAGWAELSDIVAAARREVAAPQAA